MTEPQKNAAQEVARLLSQAAAANPGFDPMQRADVRNGLKQVMNRAEAEGRIDRSLPPFAVKPGQSAQEVGQTLTEVYTKYSDVERPSIPAVLKSAFKSLNVSPDMPEYKAAMMAGVAAESATQNGYHNAQHTLEVVSNAVYLAQLNNQLADEGKPGAERLNPQEAARLVLAATIHDLGHDGGSNTVTGADGQKQLVQFRLEADAVQRAEPFMKAAGVSQDGIDEVRTMVLGTDPTGPHEKVKEAYKYHFVSGNIDLQKFPEQMEGMVADSKLALRSAILSDADLLSSGGLSVEYQQRQSARLGQEAKMDFTNPNAVLFFTDKVVGGSFTSAAGQSFNPNLETIRNTALQAKAAAEAGQQAPAAPSATQPQRPQAKQGISRP